eukprot:6225771-Lingulodinium_polyedra.AAC.1
MEARALGHVRVEYHLGPKWDQLSLKVFSMCEEPWGGFRSVPGDVIHKGHMLDGVGPEADGQTSL